MKVVYFYPTASLACISMYAQHLCFVRRVEYARASFRGEVPRISNRAIHDAHRKRGVCEISRTNVKRCMFMYVIDLPHRDFDRTPSKSEYLGT